ncbi:alpha/beta hydrolase [Micromonospora sp. DT228]|uniref:alpha/beta hydrolase n=1 Tax=Micromonospora sp. DT228 TaxID=3393443 RepID=UPI003CFA2182
MTSPLDPQIAAALAPILEHAGDLTPPPAGDVKGRRTALNGMLSAINNLEPAAGDVRTTDYHLTTADGAELLLRWYTKDGAQPGSAVLYFHGGGMILGNVTMWDGPVSRIVSRSGVPFLSVEYRLAPEHPFPVPVEDGYAALQWLHAHAGALGVDPARIAVMGNSAGGGLAAALSILARDRGGPAIARQLLIFPMLDDRNTVTDPHIAPYAAWSYDDNITAWQAILGSNAGGTDVPALAAPARITDATALPPAYIEAGQLDIFRDEDLRYAIALSRDGVPVELHLYPGAPHEFDVIAYESDAARHAIAGRVRQLRSL